MITALLRRIRRNHALEHATIHLLSRQYAHAQVAGLSGIQGYTLFTNLSTEQVVPAVMEALSLLRAGRSELAIHPNCGTNLVTAAALTTAGTLLTLGVDQRPLRRRLERLPQAILLNALLLALARPLGVWLQATVTTDAEIGTLEIASIFTQDQGPLRRIRINTRQRSLDARSPARA